jgi:hypothetical protein
VETEFERFERHNKRNEQLLKVKDLGLKEEKASHPFPSPPTKERNASNHIPNTETTTV